jgi:hypothetical protein
MKVGCRFTSQVSFSKLTASLHTTMQSIPVHTHIYFEKCNLLLACVRGVGGWVKCVCLGRDEWDKCVNAGVHHFFGSTLFLSLHDSSFTDSDVRFWSITDLSYKNENIFEMECVERFIFSVEYFMILFGFKDCSYSCGKRPIREVQPRKNLMDEVWRETYSIAEK